MKRSTEEVLYDPLLSLSVWLVCWSSQHGMPLRLPYVYRGHDYFLKVCIIWRRLGTVEVHMECYEFMPFLMGTATTTRTHRIDTRTRTTSSDSASMSYSKRRVVITMHIITCPTAPISNGFQLWWDDSQPSIRYPYTDQSFSRAASSLNHFLFGPGL